MDLQSIFDHLVDLTEPICQRIDNHKASLMLFDTSGIEVWVTENNPKYANHIIKQLKVFFKKHPLINPKTFLRNAVFDSPLIYKYLLQETSFEKAYIPLKNKLKIKGADYAVNQMGRQQIPFTLQASGHEICLPKNEIRIQQNGKEIQTCQPL